MPKIVNVVCMKWGSKYTAEDVNILYSMVKRNISIPYRFVCLTDDTSGLLPEIETLDLPYIKVPEKNDIDPWRKLGMFSKQIGDLEGKCLFLDLDIIIVDNIDCFFSYSDKFSIIENWTQQGRNIGNSSVYCFEIGKHTDVLEYYLNNMDEVLNNYDNEQIYLSKKIGDIEFWPDDWCKSFKVHCMQPHFIRYFIPPKLPKGAKIVVFHGRPKPSDVIKGGFFGRITKYTRPAKWAEDYWR